MDEKKASKFSVSTCLLIIAIIIIAIMGFFIYKINEEKNVEITKSAGLQVEVDNLNNTVSDLQSKINIISETVNSSASTLDDISYEISKKKNQTGEELIAVIKATKDGKTVTKEIEMGAVIAKTGTMVLPTIGSVALVADSGGEYYGVGIYQLVNGEIVELGNFNCGADMVKEATYSVETKGETTAVITANRNGEITKKEFEMSSAIGKTEVIDILELGKVVLVEEKDGENSTFKVFRLSQDYTNGKTTDIIDVGEIQRLF